MLVFVELAPATSMFSWVYALYFLLESIRKIIDFTTIVEFILFSEELNQFFPFCLIYI